MFDARTTPPPYVPAADRPPEHNDLTVADLVGILRRRWWVVVLIIATIGGATLFRMVREIPMYAASVSVERQPDQNLLESGWLGYYSMTPEAMAVQVAIMKSSPIVSPVVDSLGLRLVVLTPGASRFSTFSYVGVDSTARPANYRIVQDGSTFSLRSPDGGRTYGTASADGMLNGPGFMVSIPSGITLGTPVDIAIVPKGDVVSRISGSMNVNVERNTNLLKLVVMGPDPIEAAEVANAVAVQYQWYSGREKRNKAKETREFASRRLKELNDSLASTNALLSSRQSGSGDMAAGKDYPKLMLETEQRLRDLRYRESLLENVQTQLKTGRDAAFESLLAVSEVMPSASSLYLQLDALRGERTQMLAGSVAAADVVAKDAQISQKKAAISSAVGAVLAATRSDRIKTEGEFATYNQRYATMNQGLGDVDRLTQDLEGERRAFASVTDRLHEAMISEAITTSDVSIVEPAFIPTAPIDTNRSRRLILALLVALAVGVMAALLLEQLDTRIRDGADATRHSGLNVIGMIPPLRADLTLGRPLPLAMQEQAVGAEAFRKLRTSLRFVKAESPRIIAVTSPSPGEGKSVVTANLALALVQQRSSVVLIDADMRKPVQHSIFGAGRQPGLSDALVGIVAPFEALREFADMPGLHLMPCGTETPNPSELLISSEFHRMLKTLADRYDYIIIDTPPVQLVSDAAIIASIVDGTVVVVDNTKTERGALLNTVRELRQTNGSLLGVVINRAVAQRGYHGYKYYDSGYYTSTPSAPGGEAASGWRAQMKRTASSARVYLSPFL